MFTNILIIIECDWWTDRRTLRQTDRQMDHSSVPQHVCSRQHTGTKKHALAQFPACITLFLYQSAWQTGRQTDRLTDNSGTQPTRQEQAWVRVGMISKAVNPELACGWCCLHSCRCTGDGRSYFLCQSTSGQFCASWEKLQCPSS